MRKRFFIVSLLACCALLFSSGMIFAAAPLRVRLAFTGDLMVHDQQLERARTKDGWDFAPCFEAVKETVSAADLAAGNLETTLPGGGYTGYPCFGTPDSFAAALKDSGWDLLMTSNNHCLDKRLAGLERTLDVLHRNGFQTVGTYKNKAERDKVLICDVKGIKIAFAAWTYGTNGIKTPAGKEWAVSYLDGESVSRDLARARALSPDLVIALLHAGVEYRQEPPDSVKDAVAQMLACGADAVIAGHPHVLQKFEFAKVKDASGKPKSAFIAWSLGNFISFQRTQPRDVGAILELTVEKTARGTSVVSADVIPTWVQIRQSDGSRIVRVLPVCAALREPSKWKLRVSDAYRLMDAQKDIAKRLIPADAKPDGSGLGFELLPPALK